MPELTEYNPPTDPLRIIHQDDDLLVMSKPSGLLSVPGRGEHLSDCLVARAQALFPQALLVHRLDRDTSGLLVMGMNPRAQKLLGQQFERRHIKKTYIARVDGIVKDDSGHVDLPIICDWPNRPLQKVCFEQGRSAQTDWQVMERNEESNSTLMRLFPLTGRSHQLRVHMREIGHPILGDAFYASPEAFAAAPRLMLHALELFLRHPTTQEDISFIDEIENF
ncbi:MAG TPA: RNA pseudouridine synthase [Micavibrio sp.]|nr:RNA pseudouridine synthase [Micavibrio sp.]HIL29020.1 RNA pseudouridine synthase [Micavibrio sp.]